MAFGGVAKGLPQGLVAPDAELVELEDDGAQGRVCQDGVGEGLELFGASAGLEGVKVAFGGASPRRAFGGSFSSWWHSGVIVAEGRGISKGEVAQGARPAGNLAFGCQLTVSIY
jgi:hypothetical protein